MRKSLLNKVASIISIIAISFSCTSFASTEPSKQNSDKATKATTTAAIETSKGTLLFFLNPNGYPCQQQDKILKQNRENISPKADISYISTTDPTSRFSFNRYGIRRLPSLVLLDANGNISKHFPPGIRSADEIKNALSELK